MTIDDNIERGRYLWRKVQDKARDLEDAERELGILLTEMRQVLPDGPWGRALDSMGISLNVAGRLMRKVNQNPDRVVQARGQDTRSLSGKSGGDSGDTANGTPDVVDEPKRYLFPPGFKFPVEIEAERRAAEAARAELARVVGSPAEGGPMEGGPMEGGPMEGGVDARDEPLARSPSGRVAPPAFSGTARDDAERGAPTLRLQTQRDWEGGQLTLDELYHTAIDAVREMYEAGLHDLLAELVGFIDSLSSGSGRGQDRDPGLSVLPDPAVGDAAAGD